MPEGYSSSSVTDQFCDCGEVISSPGAIIKKTKQNIQPHNPFNALTV